MPRETNPARPTRTPLASAPLAHTLAEQRAYYDARAQEYDEWCCAECRHAAGPALDEQRAGAPWQ